LVRNTHPTTSDTPPQPTAKGSLGYKLGIISAALVAISILVGMFFYWRRRRMTRSIDLLTGETNVAPYLGEPATATHQPSKRRVPEDSEPVAQQPNVVLTPSDQFDAKPSTLRRRVEAVHASNEPSSSDDNLETRVDNTQEENLRRQVEQLRIELDEALTVQGNGVPPPYTR
jgi:hypothetical protein